MPNMRIRLPKGILWRSELLKVLHGHETPKSSYMDIRSSEGRIQIERPPEYLI